MAARRGLICGAPRCVHCAGIAHEDGSLLDDMAESAETAAGIDRVDIVDAATGSESFDDLDAHGGSRKGGDGLGDQCVMSTCMRVRR